MATYLFITGPEHTPEEVETSASYWWSCSKTTKNGDHALVYVKGRGIEYEWEVVSDAESHPKWKFIAYVEYICSFPPPKTLDEIRSVVTRKEWAPPYQNFRGFRSLRIPDQVAARITALRVSHSHKPSGSIRRSENDLESMELRFAEESDIEGTKTETVRLVNKRSRRLRDMALKSANGVCCVCTRDYSKLLGGLGVRVLQVHHRKQLASRRTPSRTGIADLAVVCANCHLLLHLDPTKALSIDALRTLLQDDQFSSALDRV